MIVERIAGVVSFVFMLPFAMVCALFCVLMGRVEGWVSQLTVERIADSVSFAAVLPFAAVHAFFSMLSGVVVGWVQQREVVEEQCCSPLFSPPRWVESPDVPTEASELERSWNCRGVVSPGSPILETLDGSFVPSSTPIRWPREKKTFIRSSLSPMRSPDVDDLDGSYIVKPPRPERVLRRPRPIRPPRRPMKMVHYKLWDIPLLKGRRPRNYGGIAGWV